MRESRFGGDALAALAVGFLALSAEAWAETGEPPSLPWTQAVLVAASGDARAWNPAEPLPSPGEFATDHLWVWAEDRAPSRLHPGDLARATSRSGPAFLRVLVEGPGPSVAASAASIELLAGPLEMWSEVPEDLLPRWRLAARGETPVPRAAGERLRIRAIGSSVASEWREIESGQARVVLRAHPSSVPSLKVRDDSGAPLAGVAASLGLLLPSRREGEVLARWRGDGEGLIRGLPLPSQLVVEATLFHPLALPGRLAEAASRWPAELRLARGCELQGRVVGSGSEALAHARLTGEAWLDSTSEIVVRREAWSREDGRFRIGPFPRGAGRFEIARSGSVTRREEVSLAGCTGTMAVGDVVLHTATPVSVRVEEVGGRPVVRAAVSVDGRSAGLTDGRGQLELLDLAAGASAHFEVAAEGFLPLKSVVLLRAAMPVRLQVEKAAALTGRLVRADLAPVSGGRVVIETGRTSRESEVGDDGRFRVDLPPRTAARLGFLVDGCRDTFLEVETGGPGESKSFGDVVLESGLVVRGRVVDLATGEAIAGAAAWVPRTHPGGALVAKALGLEQRAVAGEDGEFQLAGLADAPLELRLEARGFAARSVAVLPEPGAEEVDLGELPLGRGAYLAVTFQEDGLAGALVAQPESGSELARLRGAFSGGSGRLGPLPPGRVRFWAEVDRRTLCERELTVEEESAEIDVQCEEQPIHVAGEAWSGAALTDGGTLMWLPAAAGGEGALVLRRRSPLGAPRTDVFGAGRPQVDVDLSPAGEFATEDLSPGVWRVVWFSGAGVFSRPVDVRISAEPDQFVRLQFPGSSLAGRVLQADGGAAGGARVVVAGRPEWALAAADGGFELRGLDEGDYLVSATLDGRETPAVAVTLVAGTTPSPVELVFDEGEERSAQISLSSDEVAVGGALLVVEMEGRGTRLLTTDAEGRASLRLAEPPPRALRAAGVAGGIWGFGPWYTIGDAAVSYSLEVGGAGTLIVESASAVVLGLASDSGWDIGAVLRTLGVGLGVGAERPLVLPGLPAGRYRLGAGGRELEIAIEAAKTTRVDLDLQEAPPAPRG